MATKEQLTQELALLQQDLKVLTKNIESQPDNVFALQWTETKMIHTCHLSEFRGAKHRKNKMKLALTFLKFIKEEIRDVELQLKKLL